MINLGKETGPFLPWHFSNNSYNWLVAECLLRRTTRTAAEKAYSELINKYPSWSSLARADSSNIKSIIAWIGLGQQRSNQLKKLSKKVIDSYKGEVPKNRDKILALPGVGDYIADAVMLYVHKRKFFPRDSNIQRVIRRNLRRPTPIGTRHSTPYKDRVAQKYAEYVLRKYNIDGITCLHRGHLIVSWNFCRPKPICSKCILEGSCLYSVGNRLSM
jgi:A/G-specific adenine glycosylase